MTHEIPAETLNSNIEYCIDEYVRLIDHRQMLREKWFYGKTFEAIAEDHGVTPQTVKNIVYDIGDPILVRASKLSNSSTTTVLWGIVSQFLEFLTQTTKRTN